MVKSPAPAARNIFGVRSDALDCLFAVDEGSGSAFTNLATTREALGGNGLIYNHSAGVGTPVTTAWASDATGPYVDLNNGGTAAALRLWNNTLGADYTMPQGTAGMVMRIGTDGGTAAKTFLRSSLTNVNQTLRFTRAASSSNPVLIIENGASDYTYTWTGTSNTDLLLVLLTWGPRGFYAWINAVLGTPTNSPSGYTGGILTLNSAYWNAGAGANAGLQKVYQFARWNVQLETDEIDKLWADFFHMTRARSTKVALSMVPTYDPQGTTLQAKIIANEGMSGTAKVRLIRGASPIALATATPDAAWTISNEGVDNDQTISGLSAAARQPCLFEWSDDGTNYYPFPRGMQYLVSNGYVNSSTGYIEQLPISDDHVNAVADGGLQTVTGFGRDILYDPSAYPPAPMFWEGARKLYCAWQYVRAMCRDWGEPSFITVGGDNFYFDVSTANGTNDRNPSMFQAAVTWYDVFGDLLGRAPVAMRPGNHERTGLNWAWEATATAATAKQALRYYQIFACKPKRATSNVPIGLDCGYLPAEAAIPTVFTPGETLAVGDVRIPTGSGTQAKTRQYRCSIAGATSGVDNSSTWTRAIDGTATTGAATLVCEYRYDSSVAAVWTKDADGYYALADPLFYRFDFGGVRLICLDPITYQGWRNAGSNAPSTDYYRIGSAQQTFLETELADPDKPPLTMLCMHNLFGGEGIGPNEGTGNYARGSGVHCNDDAWYASVGQVEHALEKRMDRWCAHFGVHVLKDHDHTAGLCESLNGVVYVTFPGVATNEKFDTDLTYVGWNSPEMSYSYGTSESLGTVDADGNPMTRTTCRYNILGGGYIQYDVANNRYRVLFIRTGLAWNYQLLGGLLACVRILESERFIANQTVSVSGGNISLVDALNATPRPMQIGYCLDDADLVDDWWNDALYSFFAQSTVELWASARSYDAGDFVQPTTFNGTMGWTESGGTSNVSEPTWLTIGNGVNEAAVTWYMMPLWPQPYTQFADPAVSATALPVDPSASGTQRAEGVPLTVFRSDWITPAANPAIPLELIKPTRHRVPQRSRTRRLQLAHTSDL